MHLKLFLCYNLVSEVLNNMTKYYQKSLKIVQSFEKKMNLFINDIYNKNDSKYNYLNNFEIVEDIFKILKSEKEFMNFDFTIDKNEYITCKNKQNYNNEFYLSEIIFCLMFDRKNSQNTLKCLFECVGFKKTIKDFQVSYVFSSQQNELYIDSAINDFYSILLLGENSVPYLRVHNYAGLSYLTGKTANRPIATTESKELKEILTFISNIHSISLKDLNIIEKLLFEQVFFSQEQKDSFYILNDIYFSEEKWNNYTMNINKMNFKID